MALGIRPRREEYTIVETECGEDVLGTATASVTAATSTISSVCFCKANFMERRDLDPHRFHSTYSIRLSSADRRDQRCVPRREPWQLQEKS